MDYKRPSFAKVLLFALCVSLGIHLIIYIGVRVSFPFHTKRLSINDSNSFRLENGLQVKEIRNSSSEERCEAVLVPLDSLSGNAPAIYVNIACDQYSVGDTIFFKKID